MRVTAPASCVSAISVSLSYPRHTQRQVSVTYLRCSGKLSLRYAGNRGGHGKRNTVSGRDGNTPASARPSPPVDGEPDNASAATRCNNDRDDRGHSPPPSAPEASGDDDPLVGRAFRWGKRAEDGSAGFIGMCAPLYIPRGSVLQRVIAELTATNIEVDNAKPGAPEAQQ